MPWVPGRISRSELKQANPELSDLASLFRLRLHKWMVVQMLNHRLNFFIDRLVFKLAVAETCFPGGVECHREAIGVVELPIVVHWYWNQWATLQKARTLI